MRFLLVGTIHLTTISSFHKRRYATLMVFFIKRSRLIKIYGKFNPVTLNITRKTVTWVHVEQRSRSQMFEFSWCDKEIIFFLKKDHCTVNNIFTFSDQLRLTLLNELTQNGSESFNVQNWANPICSKFWNDVLRTGFLLHCLWHRRRRRTRHSRGLQPHADFIPVATHNTAKSFPMRPKKDFSLIPTLKKRRL